MRVGGVEVERRFKGAIKPGDQPGDSRETFTGTVVAVGPGDRHKPWTSIKSNRCKVCDKPWKYSGGLDAYFCGCTGHQRQMKSGSAVWQWNRGRHRMETKVGDRVVYPRRPSAPGGSDLVKIDGIGYAMFHEEQHAYAIVEA